MAYFHGRWLLVLGRVDEAGVYESMNHWLVDGCRFVVLRFLGCHIAWICLVGDFLRIGSHGIHHHQTTILGEYFWNLFQASND